MHAPTSAARSSSGLDRALGALLFALLVVGGFGVWIGIPAGILWLLGKLVESKAQHLVLALIAVPIGMVLFAALLTPLNSLYLRVNGYELAEDEDDEWVPRLRGPLDRILGVCAIIALVALLLWLVFETDHTTTPNALVTLI
jgi:hypothetical protein